MGVVLCQASCRGWVQAPIVPDTGVTMAHPGLLRVTTKDSATMMLENYIIRDDSIVGFSSSDSHLRLSVASTDVTKIETRGDTTPKALRVAWTVYKRDLRIVGVVGGIAEAAMWLR